MLGLAVESMIGALSCFRMESAHELHCCVSDDFHLHQAIWMTMPVNMISQDGADMRNTSSSVYAKQITPISTEMHKQHHTVNSCQRKLEPAICQESCMQFLLPPNWEPISDLL